MLFNYGQLADSTDKYSGIYKFILYYFYFILFIFIFIFLFLFVFIVILVVKHYSY